MTEQFNNTQQKVKLDALHQEQENLCSQIDKMAKLPYVDFMTAVYRSGEIVVMAGHVKLLQVQKQQLIDNAENKMKVV